MGQAPSAQALRGLTQPVVWVVSHAQAARWPLPPATPEDLADAALARRGGGAPRVLRRRLLRALIARLHDLHPQSIAFTRNAAGAPSWGAGHIATAGCRGWSAVAVASGPLGVDVEATGEGPQADLERWVLVEAYVKALGQGLAIAPEKVAIEPHPCVDGRARHFTMSSENSCARGDGWLNPSTAGVVSAMVLL